MQLVLAMSQGEMIGSLIGNGLGYAMLALAFLACGSIIALGIVGFLQNASLPAWPAVAPWRGQPKHVTAHAA